MALSRGEVNRIYDRLAAGYDRWAQLTESLARSRVLDRAGLRPDDRVLEVATGTGQTFTEVRQRAAGGQVVGLDVSANMLRVTARRAGLEDGVRWGLVRAEATRLPFASGHFTLIISQFLLDLLPASDVDRALAEWRRALVARGRLVVACMTPGRHWWNNLYDRLFRLAPRLAGGCRAIDAEAAVRRAGYRDVAAEYVTQLGFPAAVVAGRGP